MSALSTGVRTRLLRGALALLPMLVVLGFRFLGPEDLDDNDQAKQALYALDIRENANWILPQERGTLPASKPPLYAWLAASASWPWSTPSALACRLPSALASLAIAWLVLVLATERFGERSGMYAAWLYACTHTAVNLSIHVRPDALLALLCTAALFALHRVELGRPQGAAPLFWIACALSVLAKGPVGLLVPLGGSLAVCVSQEGRSRCLALLRSAWGLSLLVPVTWALLAYLVGGSQYVRETVLAETLDRALGIGTHAGREGAVPGQLLGHFLVKGFPISILALCASASLATRGGRARRPQLMLPCGGFAVGLIALSLSHGQRQDYVLPFLPAAAVAAGALLGQASMSGRVVWAGLLWATGAVTLVGGGVMIARLPVAAGLSPLGVVWGGVLAVTGALLVLLAIRAARDVSAPRAAHVAAGVAALLLLHGLYNAALSPVARTARERDVRAFAADVRELSNSHDRMRIATGVRGSVFFFLGHNEPALSAAEIGAYDTWAPPGGRMLLVANAEQRPDLDALWPGRFKLLAHRNFENTSEGLVLLEDAGAEMGP